jgi:GH25 family lysozyme M1 (1,4-beta-N-acetylmuramidase)
MLRGTDISAYQSSIPAGDFCIMKATEGLSYNDGPFVGRWRTLAQRGTLRGAYHFSHPKNDPTAEADHFLRIVRAAGLKPGDILVLDHEASDGTSAAHCAAWARTWCQHVTDAVGYKPVVYTFLSFAQEGRCEGLGQYPLWMADPSRPAGNPRVPAPWTKWVLHQYGSPGGVDANVFNGDRAAWLALGGSHNPTPAPTPQQEEDMPYGQLAEGKGAITPIALAKGKYKTFGAIGDNGLQVLPAAALRVAVHDAKGWHVTKGVIVDSAKGQRVVTFTDPATTDGLSVQREDAGDVHVAWEVS